MPLTQDQVDHLRRSSPLLGESARAAYDIGDGVVMKVPTNDGSYRGSDDNLSEYALYQKVKNTPLARFLATAHEVSPDGDYLLAEKVKPCTRSVNDGHYGDLNSEDKADRRAWNMAVRAAGEACGLHLLVSDAHAGNWGRRESTGELVLLDYAWCKVCERKGGGQVAK